MTKKLRVLYAILFCALLLTEILIALFVRDDFVRPYVGDMLVTVLLCSFVRIILPKGLPGLSIYVFLFATAVEIGQYFDMVKLLGLENSRFFSVLLGTTFSPADLLCYALGCIAFWFLDRMIQRHLDPT